ncbi:hypothetical protein FHU23_004342 [Clostridium saccharobutylicum]|nr:hypothetical protein [Clostridium saccharobutylicum]MBA8983823.1 hypothetical protein [Clostridium saccharobutylicum]MBA8997604.1 hypothetical protein [Clostridium saccharobutylicum]NOV54809.1 hypothetical protein [Clostridium saccharobutylicum]NOV83691.1 hypothetical protein [Clostridium saccharobutylicum]
MGFLKQVVSMTKMEMVCENIIKRECGEATLLMSRKV